MTFTGDGVQQIDLRLPANFKRMLLTSQVYPSWAPRQPLVVHFRHRRVAGAALEQRNKSTAGASGRLIGNDMLIHPILAVGQSVTFAYLDKNCVRLAGGNGDQFIRRCR